MNGDKEIVKFLKRLMKESFNQGDDYYAILNRKGTAYIFGYVNDYPLQHGEGEQNKISISVAKLLFNRLGGKI